MNEKNNDESKERSLHVMNQSFQRKVEQVITNVFHNAEEDQVKLLSRSI